VPTETGDEVVTDERVVVVVPMIVVLVTDVVVIDVEGEDVLLVDVGATTIVVPVCSCDKRLEIMDDCAGLVDVEVGEVAFRTGPPGVVLVKVFSGVADEVVFAEVGATYVVVVVSPEVTTDVDVVVSVPLDAGHEGRV